MASIQKNAVIPIDLCSILFKEHDAEINLLDENIQIYGKALHGEGKVLFKNGNLYQGNFENGFLHGNGTFTWENGVKYCGSFIYNRIDGEGTFTWPDTSFYRGEVKNGLRDGIGTFCSPNNEVAYNGEWKNGLRHGYGKITFKSGGYYEGYFDKGYKSGKGQMFYKSGSSYSGDWHLDKKKGYGTMVWTNLNEKYYGQWDDNRQNNWGTHIWLEQKGEGKYLRNRYEGQWKNGLREGLGVFYYANGAKYEGEWLKNIKHGGAIFIDENGKEGFFLFQEDKILKELGGRKMEGKEGGRLEEKLEVNLENMRDKLNTEFERTEKGKEKKEGLSNGASPDKLRRTKTGFNKLTQDKTHESKKENESPNKKGELDPNPFFKLLDLEDILINNPPNNREIFFKNLTNMLLRHNPSLKKFYKHCSGLHAKDEEENENILTVSLSKFWVFLKEIKIFTPFLTLATINRFFSKGKKNVYTLNPDLGLLKQKINFLKRAQKESDVVTLDDEEISIILLYEGIQSSNKNESNVEFVKCNIHDGSRPLLYRHFVDLMVRLAFLKYSENDIDNLHRGLEKLIQEKIEPTLEAKKKKKDMSFSSGEHLNKKYIEEEDKKKIYALFLKKLTKNSTAMLDIRDETILVKTIMHLLMKAGFLKTEHEKNIFFHQIERHFDPEESLSIFESRYQAGSASSPTNQDKKEIKKALAKEKEKEKEYQITKNKRTVLLLETEVLFDEFIEILTYFFSKTSKEFKMENSFNYIVKKFIFCNQQEKQKEAKRWPISEKEKMVKDLSMVFKEIKQKKLEERLMRERLEEEKKQEIRERHLMKIEDIDVKSLSSQEQSEATESDSEYY